MMDDIPEDARCIVETSNGPICGYINREDESIHYKFKSIPYAKPPLGNLRFMPPIPPTPWSNLLDCTKDASLPLCLHTDKEIVGSEDCLYIEVSTPSVKPDKLMPVMFWIGSYNYVFYIDSVCDPTLIVDQDIVFVRCGFRLGPIGFLSINEITAPGNVGLKDIVMALHWIQRNIKNFGGDPTNVTIFGSSTGGSTAHFMMLSPMATGLFHKVIMQSASALNKWALSKNPSQAVLELAKELGIKNTNKFDIVEELRLIPAMDIMKAYVQLTVNSCDCEGDHFDAIFKPCVEEEFEGQPMFLNRSPALIIKGGNFNKVPIIIGSNNIEASVLHFMKDDFYADFEKFNRDVSLLVPRSLSLDESYAKKIGVQLLNFYFTGTAGTLNEHTRTQYLQLLSDYYFLYYVNKTVKFHSQYTLEFPVYYYIVNYAGEWSVPKQLDFLNSIGHSAELAFLFRMKPGLSHCEGSRDSVTTRNRVIKMWTNFAKYGNPTPDDNDPLLQITWDPVVDEKTLNYLSISSELTKGRNPFYERMKFWEKLHDEHLFLQTSPEYILIVGKVLIQGLKNIGETLPIIRNSEL